jgi:glycosyltransferase involved in cell wall biosynthesis
MNRSVSVVIPTYNRAALLPYAVDSALAQSNRPLEIIVVDDGSKDATEDVCKRYGDAVTYVRQPNAGASRARNMESRSPAAT